MFHRAASGASDGPFMQEVFSRLADLPSTYASIQVSYGGMARETAS